VHVGETTTRRTTVPHLHGDLSKGTLDGAVVTCPRHGSQFDVTDGRVLLWTDFSTRSARLLASCAIRAPFGSTRSPRGRRVMIGPGEEAGGELTARRARRAVGVGVHVGYAGRGTHDRRG